MRIRQKHSCNAGSNELERKFLQKLQGGAPQRRCTDLAGSTPAVSEQRDSAKACDCRSALRRASASATSATDSQDKHLSSCARAARQRGMDPGNGADLMTMAMHAIGHGCGLQRDKCFCASVMNPIQVTRNDAASLDGSTRLLHLSVPDHVGSDSTGLLHGAH